MRPPPELQRPGLLASPRAARAAPRSSAEGRHRRPAVDQQGPREHRPPVRLARSSAPAPAAAHNHPTPPPARPKLPAPRAHWAPTPHRHWPSSAQPAEPPAARPGVAPPHGPHHRPATVHQPPPAVPPAIPTQTNGSAKPAKAHCPPRLATDPPECRRGRLRHPAYARPPHRADAFHHRQLAQLAHRGAKLAAPVTEPPGMATTRRGRQYLAHHSASDCSPELSLCPDRRHQAHHQRAWSRDAHCSRRDRHHQACRSARSVDQPR